METTDRADLFHTLRTAQDADALLALASQQTAADLDALEAYVEAQLAAAATASTAPDESANGETTADESAALTERLAVLRQARAFQTLSAVEQALLAFTTARGPADIMALVGRTPDDLLDALEQRATELVQAAEGEEADDLRRRRDDLRGWRTTETAAHARLAGVDEAALVERLIAWIQQPDWDASQAFLAQHAADLLGDAADAALTLLLMVNAGNDDVQLHHNLLAACRAQGIDAAYAQLYKQNRFAQYFSTPLGEAVLGFASADSDEAARHLLHDEPLLLTADARTLLALLVEEEYVDEAARPQVLRRQSLWDEAWRARAGRAGTGRGRCARACVRRRTRAGVGACGDLGPVRLRRERGPRPRRPRRRPQRRSQ